MNIYRDLLAVDETALQRMRSLITDGSKDRSEIYYRPDVDLVIGEIERVRERLDHWLGRVFSATSRKRAAASPQT